MRAWPFFWHICCLALVLAADPIPTRTIIDVLSSSPEFSVLVELLQHHELVPLINQSWNSTFLAPLNSAFIGVDTDSITTDQLLYHFLNSTVTSSQFKYQSKLVNTYLDDGDAMVLLNLEQGINNGKAEFTELDLMASPQRGVVHSISTLLSVPNTVSAQLFLNNDLKLFSDLVGKTDLSGSTILAPTSDALLRWLADEMNSTSSDIAYEYLRSPFGDIDRDCLVDELAVSQVISPEYLPMDIELRDGTQITVHPNLSVTGPDFGANAEGVLHVARDGLYIELDAVVAPRSLLTITPEKFILGLGGYRLVRSLDLYGYHSLIDESSLISDPRVIIVPTGRDDEEHESVDVPVYAEADLGNLMLYQFFKGRLPKQVSEKLLDSHMLLRSGKYPQRVHYERRPTGSQFLNWEVLSSDAHKLGNTTFYTAEELLATPPKLTMALGPLLVSSHSLSFLEKLGRLQPSTSQSWTFLVPTRDAWEVNTLLKNYLEQNDDALERVFDNLIFSTPLYSDSPESTVDQFAGMRSTVSWAPEDRVLHISNDEIDADIKVEVTDVLFDNGVAHIVSEFALPTDLEVAATDLIKASHRSHFLDLLHSVGMDEVFDPHANYTLLVPPDKEFKKHNITPDMDPRELRTILELLLLPNNPLRCLLDGDTGQTLSGEELELHQTSPSSRVYALAPKDGLGQQVLLTDFGNTNGKVAGGSTVVFIDRFISPEWVTPPRFHLRDGTYTVLGVLIGLVLGCALIIGLAIRISKPKDGFLVDTENGRGPDYRDDPSQEEEEASEARPTDPVQTPSVSGDRAFGRHLNLGS